jgi:hypothetical protein
MPLPVMQKLHNLHFYYGFTSTSTVTAPVRLLLRHPAGVCAFAPASLYNLDRSSIITLEHPPTGPTD